MSIKTFTVIAAAAAVFAGPASAAVVVANSTQFNVGYTVSFDDALTDATVTAGFGDFMCEGRSG